MVEMRSFEEVITAHFGSDCHQRLVGMDRRYDSGYDNIYRFFGENGIDPSLVQLRHTAKSFQFNDEKILYYASKYERKLRDEGRLHDGPEVVRLVNADLETDLKSILVQRASYGQFAGSCFFLDSSDPIFGERETLRAYYLATRKSSSRDDNPLAACFGVSGMLLVEEGNQTFMLRVRRSANLATLSGTFGPSVAGVVDYDNRFQNLKELTTVSLSQEVNEELSLSESEYQIIPLAYSHELFRGEHPQLFCLVRCSLTRELLANRLSAIKGSANEFDQFDFLPMTEGRLADAGVLDDFNFEGKMNYYLAEEYLA